MLHVTPRSCGALQLFVGGSRRRARAAAGGRCAGASSAPLRRRRGWCRRPRRPARGMPSASPAGSRPRRSRRAVRGCSCACPHDPGTTPMVRVASVSRYGKDRSMLPIHGEPSTQILIPTWRTMSSPLSGVSSVVICAVGHLVGAQPDRQLVTQLLEHRPEHRVERHLRAGGQAGAVEPGALGEQHRRVVARAAMAPASSGNTAPVSSAVPSSSPSASRPYLAPLGSGVSRVSPARGGRRRS